jgi:hypothetical protein
VIDAVGADGATGWKVVETDDRFPAAPPVLDRDPVYYWVVALVDGEPAIWLVDEDMVREGGGFGVWANDVARRASDLGADLPVNEWGLDDAESYQVALACL